MYIDIYTYSYPKSTMDYYYNDRGVGRARGRLVASRQAFFEQAGVPIERTENSRPITSLVDEKLEMFTKSTQEASRNLAKSTPDLTALEQDANLRVSQHLSKSKNNLNQTFDSSMFRCPPKHDEVDHHGSSSPNKSFSSYFTAKKPPLPPRKPCFPPPPAPMLSKTTELKSTTVVAPPVCSIAASTHSSRSVAPMLSKISEFDRIVNSIKSTDSYRRYKNHPAMSQPDIRRRSKSLGFLELDDDDNWVLPSKPTADVFFPELSECSVSTTHLAKQAEGTVSASAQAAASSAAAAAPAAATAADATAALSTTSEDEVSDYEDVPIPCNRLTAAKSEYELRVEKSLKNLNLPDWYTKSSRPSSRASILSGRGTPAMSSERFSRNRSDYESFRSAFSVGSSSINGPASGTPKRGAFSRTTTPSWRSFSRRSPPTPNSESEHQTMEKTQNWINSQHSMTAITATGGIRGPYTGWRHAKDLSDTEFSSSFEDKRYGNERYSFVQAVNHSVLTEDRSSMESSFDSTPIAEYHNKVWIESSLISKPTAADACQQSDYHQGSYQEENYPAYKAHYDVYEKRENRHPDVIYNKEKPPRPSTRHPFSGGLLEAVV